MQRNIKYQEVKLQKKLKCSIRFDLTIQIFLDKIFNCWLDKEAKLLSGLEWSDLTTDLYMYSNRHGMGSENKPLQNGLFPHEPEIIYFLNSRPSQIVPLYL